MNQRPTGLSLSKATVAFLQYKSAEGLSPVTVSGYDHDLKLWIEYQGDVDVAEVETTHMLAYLNHLRTDYIPRRITGNNDKKLSPKTVYNLYISVASFFTWASREFQIHNPVKGVPRPRVPEDAPVEPFKKAEIELLIKLAISVRRP
jgi:site-specific recombinase XerD